MTPRNKKIILAILILLLIVVIVFLFMRRSETPGGGGGFLGGIFPGGGNNLPPDTYPPNATSTGTGGSGGGGELPNAIPNWVLTPLGSDPVASLYVGTSSVWYHKKTPESLGYLFSRERSNLEIEKSILNYLVQGIAKVTWSPDGKKAIIWYRDDENAENVVRKFFIDYSSSTPRTRVLADNIADIVFSPDSLFLGYIQNDASDHSIFTVALDFKKPKKIFSGVVPGMELFWPEKETLALKTKSSFAIKSFLYSINIKTGVLTKIIDGLGIDAIWSKDATWIVYSSTDKNGSLLPLKLIHNKTKREIDLPFKTLAEKCVFGKFDVEQLYCAVPDNRNNQYPDAWWQGQFKNEDSLFIINVAIDPQKVLAAKSLHLDLQSLGTFWDDTRIFFIDRTTRLPWTIKFADEVLFPRVATTSSTTPSR